MINKQKFVLDMLYGYHGAACHDVRVTEEDGLLEARNSYGELMFKGYSVREFLKFMTCLSENKLS